MTTQKTLKSFLVSFFSNFPTTEFKLRKRTQNDFKKVLVNSLIALVSKLIRFLLCQGDDNGKLNSVSLVENI